jgi:heterodisulfide reductase subunit A
MDIPDSVTMASSAAAVSAELLSEQRGTLTVTKEYPPERDVSGEPPRIGVFVCRCGTNIARVVDVTRLVRYAKNLDDVVHAEENMFSCSIDSAKHIVETIKEKELNRVVVAACTPRTHEPLFQDTLREAGLNPYLFEFANIREHCSWVHMRDRAAANRKAQDIVRMAVTKARLLEPLHLLSLGLNHSGLVVGAGVAGMEAALSLAKQGFEVHLVEKDSELGGIARRIHYNLNGDDIQTYLQDLVARVYENPLIHVYTEANILEASGYMGNFATKIAVGAGKAVKEIAHGATIIATGATEFKPQEYLYSQDPRVLTLLELEEEIAKGDTKIASVGTAVIILCVGSRDEERPYCSRVCCKQSIRNALKLKEINPKIDIYVLYRDMRTYALAEDYYREAADKRVKFIRYEASDGPEVEAVEEGGRSILRVTVPDLILGQRLMIDADLVALATATVAQPGNKELSRLFKTPLNEDGFFLEAHMKLRPVDFATDGIFMCGLAHSPKSLDESIAQAKAAASRAATILAKDTIVAGGAVCTVNEDVCSGCGTCQALCPYGAIAVDVEEQVAKVNEALCKGCGVCCAACPSGAAEQKGFTADQLLHMISATLLEV